MKFSKRKRVVLLLLLAALAIGWFSQVYSIMLLPESTVAIVQSAETDFNNIQAGEIDSMVREAVRLAGGFAGLVADGDTVVIKPNLVTMDSMFQPLPPELNGITTDWRVAQTVVDMIRELNPSGDVYIMEGSASATQPIMTHMKYTPAYMSGVTDFICLDTDSGAWQDFSAPEIVNVTLPNGRLHVNYYLNKIYKEADVLISLPVLKNHEVAGLTGSLKNVGIGTPPGNIYGQSASNPWKWDMVDHSQGNDDIQKWIHDWYLCRPIDFVIMDGLVGLQNGPGGYNTMNLAADQMNMRVILASRDAVAVDTIEGLLCGWDPESINHIVYLNDSEQGNMDVSRIKVVGAKVDMIKKSFEGTSGHGTMITDTTAPSLVVDSHSTAGANLNLALSVAAETKKVEIEIDGEMLEETITGNYTNVNIGIGMLSQGSHSVTVHAYDRFLNRSEASFTITTNGSSPTPDPTTVSPLIPGATIQTVYSGNLYYEGPMWDPVTEKLYFTTPNDAPYNVYRLDGPNQVSVWMNGSSAINGLFLSNDGRMLAAEQDDREIASYRIGVNGPEDAVSLARNASWNRPNDLCQTAGGDIYFTGPDWGSYVQAVYHLDTAGNVTEVITNLPKPNGVITSLDDTKLYVSDSDNQNWMVYPINGDGSLGTGSVFFAPPSGNSNGPDGMTIDEFGNLYFCGKGGLWIVSPTGEQLDFVSIPEFNSNVTFGGPEGKTLYITCQDKVYSLETNVRGANWRDEPATGQGDVNGDGNINIVDALMVAQYTVGLNPNPFNPAMADVSGNGRIDIVDALMIAQYTVGLIPEL